MERKVADLLACSFINLDKPKGPTSHQVVTFVKRILGVGKAGHAGTLDPKAVGVLPIGIGKATRLCYYLLGCDKTYVGTAWLHQNLSIKRLRAVKKKFVGKIIQLPPVRARVKRVPRVRQVYSFTVPEKRGKEFLFKLSCQAGTYARKLISDFGNALGVGAHMTGLRRISDGPFNETDSVTLYELAKAFEEYRKGKSRKLKAYLLSAEAVMGKVLPSIVVSAGCIKKLSHGAPVFASFVKKKVRAKTGCFVSVYSETGRLVEIARLVRKKRIYAMPETVIT